MTDVVIIGAGPAGLALGCYLARARIPCVIVERENHPRPHVGESLMPATLRVMREIGFLPLLDQAGFPHSRGVVYHPQIGFDVELPYSDFPQEGIDRPYTYQVDRGKFDLLLLKHAETLGCDVVQGVSVDEVAFEEGRATGVRATAGGEPLFLPGRVVVDAAGRGTHIGRQLGLRRDHTVLDQLALHGWFTGVDRGRRRTAAWTHVYFIPEIRGWAWQAPIDEELTSIGVVAARESYRESGLDPESFFQAGLRGNRKLARVTHRAGRVNDLEGDVAYSYRLDQVCGDGWLTVGDAARFIDPVFSSGVAVAMRSARSAAIAIGEALEKDDVSRDAFADYEHEVLTAGAIWDDFTRLFYRLLPGFTHLVESREHRRAIARMIQGDILDHADAGVLEELRALVRSVEEADAHPWRNELVAPPS